MSLRVNYAIGGGGGKVPLRRRIARIQLGIFDRPERDLHLDHRALGHMLVALVAIDCDYLRAHPDLPSIYDPSLGIRYTMAYERNGEEFADVPTVLRRRGGDCFPAGTLLLREDRSLASIEDVQPGDRIWGFDRFSTVEASAYKGELSVDGIVLNNGAIVQLTGDHHVYVLRCEKHAGSNHPYGCSCSPEDRVEERVRVRDLREKDVLRQPDRIAFGSGGEGADISYVEGLYVSDGWSDRNRFAISGQDGCPKEEQKREVQEICERLGIATRWHRKYIAVNDGAWTRRLFDMGTRAPNKRLLSLDLSEENAAAILRGVMADSGANSNGGRTFTTTSKTLFVQTRVLQRMFGRACGSCFIEDHGGLGENPIYRLNVRENRQKGSKILRVREVLRDVATVPCFDIQTDDHRVYLPEHDVTVSNCDDLASFRVAELRVRHRIAARPYAVHRYEVGTRRPVYHVMVELPDGTIEDPSRRLGMGGKAGRGRMRTMDSPLDGTPSDASGIWRRAS